MLTADDVDDDEPWTTEVCRQCRVRVVMLLREARPDGPWICDPCITATLRREAERLEGNPFPEIVLVSGRLDNKGE